MCWCTWQDSEVGELYLVWRSVHATLSSSVNVFSFGTCQQMRYHDGRFGRHPRWRFLIFNLLIRRKAGNSARFYVSKVSGLKDFHLLRVDGGPPDGQVSPSSDCASGFYVDGHTPILAEQRDESTGASPLFDAQYVTCICDIQCG
jgi:hypothetical protein